MRTRQAHIFLVSLAGLFGVQEVATDTNLSIKVCGGFTDGGLLNDDCCYTEAFGIAFAQLAWERGILPRPASDVNLVFNYVDVEGDPGNAISCAFAGWRTENSALVLGGGWSSLTKPMAQLGGSLGEANLDWGGTSDELSDSKVYPLLSRVAAPDASLAIGLAELLVQQYLSSRVVIIHETGDWGQTLTTKLTEQLYSLNPDIDLKLVPLLLKPVDGDQDTLRSKLLQLRGKMYRHFVVVALEPVTLEVLAEDQFSYIVGPRTFLLAPGDILDAFKGISDTTRARFAGMQIFQLGSEDIGQNLTLLSNFWMSLTADDFPEPLRTIIPCMGGATSAKVDCWWGGSAIFSNNEQLTDQYFTLAFDAAWLLNVAVQSLVASGTSADEMRGSTLHDALLEATSVGLTGRIILRGNGDRIMSTFNLKYLDSSGVWRLAGKFDSVLKSMIIEQDPIYADNSTSRPPDSFHPCSPGHFRDGTECTAAPAGFYVPMGVVLGEPLECTKGTFSTGSGNALCPECSPGRYQNSTGQSDCRRCPELFFTKSSRQSFCEPCPEGHVQAEGAAGCLRCAQGTYRSASDKTCIQCPEGRTTAFMAATDLQDCQCRPGTYRQVGNGSCISCPEGMICEFGSNAQFFKVHGGTDVNIPLLQAGYYSVADKPLSIYQCIDKEGCPGGLPASCLGQREGLVCARCPVSYAVDKETGECLKCPGAMPVVFALMPVLMVTAIIFSYYAGNSKLTVNASVMLTCSVAGGIITCSFQVLAVFRLLSVPWPRSSFDGLNVFSIFGLDIDTVTPECTIGYDATGLYLMRILIPIVFVLLVFLIYGLVNSVGVLFGIAPWILDKVWNTIGQILQMLFIAFAVIVVRPFECFYHPNGEASVYLFPQVLCWSSEHVPLIAMAVAELVFLLIPYAALCIWANHKAPQIAAADSGDEGNRSNMRFLTRFRFLLYRFRPDIWWWGNPFLLRQAFLAFASSLPSDDPHGQIIYIVLTLAVYATGVTYNWPWKTHVLNYLDLGSTVSLQMIIVVATAFIPRSPNGSTYGAICSFLISMLGVYITGFVIMVAASVVRRGPFAEFEDYSLRKRDGLATKFFKCSEILVMMGSTKCETMVRLMNGHDRDSMWNALIVWQSVLSDFLPPDSREAAHVGEDYRCARLSHCRYTDTNHEEDLDRFRKSMSHWDFQEHYASRASSLHSRESGRTTCEPGEDTICKDGGNEYTVVLDKKQGAQLGLGLETAAGTCVIARIKNEGLVGEWNERNPSHQLMLGDSILEVNGIRDDGRKILDECKKDAELTFRLRRKAAAQDNTPLIESSTPPDLLDWTDVWTEGPRMCPRGSPRLPIGSARRHRPYTPVTTPINTNRGRAGGLAVTPQASGRQLEHGRPVTPPITGR